MIVDEWCTNSDDMYEQKCAGASVLVQKSTEPTRLQACTLVQILLLIRYQAWFTA